MFTPTKDSKVEKYLSVGLIVLVAVIAYAPLINSFGYYLDDWYVVWAGRVFGPDMIAKFHQFDRPLMGYIYAFHYRILGDDPLGWQIYALILRLVGALTFWWILRVVWPNSSIATTSATLLFVVYPGFLQQPNAGLFSNFIFSLTLALISIAFTIRAAISRNKWKIVVYQVLSVLFAASYLFYIEFMIGLETLRWIFLWLTLNQSGAGKILKDRIKHWVQYAIPTLIVTLGMIIWRGFIFESGRMSMNIGNITGNFASSPFHSIVRLFIETGRDVIETVFSAWFVPAYQMSANASYREWGTAISFGLFAIVVYLGYILIVRKRLASEFEGAELPRSLFWVGIVGVVALLFPVIAVGRQVFLDLVFNGFNRYTIHASVGVSLLIVGSLLIAARRAGLIGTVALLMGFAVFTHYFNGLRYQEDWEYQKDLWWQLTWRAPDLQDETLLTALLPKYPFIESHEIWGPANIIYRPNSSDIKISGEILNSGTVGWFQRAITDERVIRGVVPMTRNFGNTLILSIPDSLSCLHAMDGNRLEDYREPLIAQSIFDKSHIDRIVTDASETITPPNEIFGLEPEHRWCYYYQKISLAHQRGDWEEASALADEAEGKGFKPLNRSEWIPVFEAYVNAGRLDDAKHLATIIKDDKDLKYLYCSQIDFVQQNPDYESALIQSLICE